MSPITVTFYLTVVMLIQICSCWPFTEVNYEMLKAKSDYPEDDFENEIDIDGVAHQKISLIYPGTKWCGAGNIADNYDDLGSSREVDMCCRDHDNCPDVISAGETKYNLTNNAYYSRLSCNCDENFRQCLHATNGTTAKRIGVLYFNGLGTQCYRKDYLIVGCNIHGGWFNRKCIDYKLDTNGNKSYQWFDVVNY